MQKLTISIACSIGLHALLLLYWHNHQTNSQQENIRLTSHNAVLSEPLRFILQPPPQQPDAPDTQPAIVNPEDPAEDPPQEEPPSIEQTSPNITTEESTLTEELADIAPSLEDLTVTDQATGQDTIQRTAPDLFSIRQQIQQHAPLIDNANSQPAKCQQYRRMQGMVVDCQQARYAALTTGDEEMSQAAQTEQQLSNLLNGPALVSPAREFDASDTGNRIDANRDMVGDQLQGNQLRKAIMNQR